MPLINIRLVLVAQSCPTLCHPFMAHQSPPSMVLQAIIVEGIAFPPPGNLPNIQGANTGLLHCRQTLYHLSYREDLNIRFKDPKERIQEYSQSRHRLDERRHGFRWNESQRNSYPRDMDTTVAIRKYQSSTVIILKLDPSHLVDTNGAGMCPLRLSEPAVCKLSLAVVAIMWLW